MDMFLSNFEQCCLTVSDAVCKFINRVSKPFEIKFNSFEQF